MPDLCSFGVRDTIPKSLLLERRTSRVPLVDSALQVCFLCYGCLRAARGQPHAGHSCRLLCTDPSPDRGHCALKARHARLVQLWCARHNTKKSSARKADFPCWAEASFGAEKARREGLSRVLYAYGSGGPAAKTSAEAASAYLAPKFLRHSSASSLDTLEYSAWSFHEVAGSRISGGTPVHVVG